jgi:hypothetical protein
LFAYIPCRRIGGSSTGLGGSTMNTHPLHENVGILARPTQRRLSQTFGIALLLGAVALSGCATNSPARHEYIMRGQVLSVDGDVLEVCIGERDGAEVGQVLNVVRHTKKTGSPKAGAHQYKREDIGKVRITSLFEDHYANATVVNGQPSVNDTVELER